MVTKPSKRLLDQSIDAIHIDSFSFKRKYRDAVAHLDDSKRLAFYESLFEAAFDRVDATPLYESDDQLMIGLTLAIPEVDESAIKTAQGKANGLKGGRGRKGA